MKWLAPLVLWAAAACGESVIVASEVVSDTDTLGECTDETTPAEPAPAVLELVVDTSGTMDEPPSNDGRSSKWTLTREALLDSIEAMPEQTSVGVVFFPDTPAGVPCFDFDADVPVGALEASGSQQRKRIVDAFRAQAPDGSAPTHDAYHFAFEQLAMSQAPGRRFMLLITDDYPTHELGCRAPSNNDPVDASRLITETGAARANGVSTFVMGLPGSGFARSTLSRMAFAGGTAPKGCSHDGPRFCHFDVTNEQSFSDAIERALRSITGTALSCSYSVPAASSGAAFDLDRLQVSFNAEDGPTEALERIAAGPCDDGWRSSPDGSTILLCDSTCDRVREGKGRIEFGGGCAAQSP